MKNSKVDLRKTYRAKRKKILPSERQQAAQAAAHIFRELAYFKHSQHIACYLSMEDEFDSYPLIEAIWQAKKICYLPIVSEEKENVLRFVAYEYGDALRLNRYAILEPVKVVHTFSAQQLDLVMTPLIAFDGHGHRLGSGGGFYDRTFAFLKSSSDSEKKPVLLGLAYAAQQIENLPVESWDISLTGVITESQFLLTDAKQTQ